MIKILEIEITNELLFDTSSLPKKLISDIKKDFRVVNPSFDYEASKNNDKYDVPKYLNIYTEYDNGFMGVPRGTSIYLSEWFSIYGIECDYIDNRLSLDEIEFPELKYELFLHQKKWVKKASLLSQGTIESPCFVRGSQVSTVDGYKNIEDVKVDDLVFAYDTEEDEVVLKKVLKTKKIPIGNRKLVCVTIKTYKEEIKIVCTDNHKFYSDGEWVMAKDLKGRKVFVDNEPLYRNRSWLYQKYVIDRLTRKQIADIFGISEKTVGMYTENFGLFVDKPCEENRLPRNNYCKCGCGRKCSGDYCKGHHQKIRFQNMSEEDKMKFLKNWIDVGYKSMMEGRKKWWDSLSDDDKRNALQSFIDAGNKASLASASKGSRPQRKVYNYLRKRYSQYKWEYDAVVTTKGKGSWQIDIRCKELNLCIEHDGPVHRKPIFGKSRLNEQKNRDRIKNKILIHNGYFFMRVIDDRLDDKQLLKKLKKICGVIDNDNFVVGEVMYI